MPDHTQELQQMMKLIGILSFKTLSDRSSVSLGSISKLRRGQADLMKYRELDNLGTCLGLSIDELITKFSQIKPQKSESQGNSQAQLEFQQEVLIKLESMLLQFPTAAFAAINNPNLPARNLLPLFRPLENLLKDWNIEAIAPVGSEVDFNPQLHLPMEGSESVNAGDQVLVRYTGYVRGEKLLYRARVSSV